MAGSLLCDSVCVCVDERGTRRRGGDLLPPTPPMRQKHMHRHAGYYYPCCPHACRLGVCARVVGAWCQVGSKDKAYLVPGGEMITSSPGPKPAANSDRRQKGRLHTHTHPKWHKLLARPILPLPDHHVSWWPILLESCPGILDFTTPSNVANQCSSFCTIIVTP